MNATVTWQPSDVMTVFDITEAEAEEWLENNRKHIQDRLIEVGWDVIRTLGQMDGLKEAAG